MGNGTKEKKGLPVNAVRICIDGLEDDDVRGRTYSRLWEEPLVFTNCGKMLLQTDSMFDEKGIPQTFRQKRSFTEGPEPLRHCSMSDVSPDADHVLEQKGDIATFDVIVRTRHRAGWQGILRSDSGEVQEFYSEIELLKSILRIAREEMTRKA